ncbi:transposase, IS4 family [Psychroflexus torquis ATCC 700755]|uniref:Transposase, IS4 family n=1 Tax=Psychroflexus torquis (strain ATCC 700755 / CIP 106069 / ACAM 623) TaxID=313595 RepID=K4IXC6_PSYTT|nr:transposase, IS4 family [Psychroflexus torquis ATCC 700755]
MKISLLNLFKLLIFSILIVNFNEIILNTKNNNKDYKLVKLYDYVCKKFDEQLQFESMRFSNNNTPKLTDQEIVTIYLFVMEHQGIFKMNKIHQFASEYLLSWFPDLVSYQAFNRRINRLSNVMNTLVGMILTEFTPKECSTKFSVLDSMPIVTCSGKRSGKVAPDITDKGFCSTKSMYYYGMKLHALGFCNPTKLPHPEQIIFTAASVNDFALFKEAWSEKENRTFFGDKIYQSKSFFTDMYANFNSEMLTPVKAVKGMPDVLKKFDRAANDLYSRAVSKIRQPIEALFSWLIEKSDIQKASKVRSTKGLNLHVYGRLAAAFITLLFNS